MLINQTSIFNRFLLEPVREIYEAFVIYTFFSLLTDMLGGERNIIIMTSGRKPVPHPGMMRYVLSPLDISDPKTFLSIKRGILQYVWLKPCICFGTLFFEFMGWYNVNDMSLKSIYLWMTLIYNASVTLSLYSLAIFWKILWDDLKPFKPVGKFLCVKLIIFASYWQGVILAILNFFQVLPGSENNTGGDGSSGGGESIGVGIQNALLCVELIAFAIGHWYSFSYFPFTISQLPWGRYKFYYALKDWLGFKDLLIDFRKTFKGDHYKDYRQFDSVEAVVAHPESKGRMSRIHQGLRYHYDGKHKHWLPDNSSLHNGNNGHNVPSTSEIHALDNASLLSNNTSMRAMYPQSPTTSPPGSPSIGSDTDENTSLDGVAAGAAANAPTLETTIISDIIHSDSILSTIDYTQEQFDRDESIYEGAIHEVGNYALEDDDVKRLLNYPIVDGVLDSHVYGYKVQKLRQRQDLRKSKQRKESILQSNQSYRYGSIV
ncbi:hypothetical protein KGF57_005312 [Candida theae]|uniref:DUF300-domain-containing protein n=1 Tax=Candida theae TaxID=1198502 RepID=A0AAD5FWB0_9ASCO|nr:uncharacterized protein KGF57_005312 [Candida theae]KAI5948701.1 hypothetical protein KGF57_005312 [Candida theae]